MTETSNHKLPWKLERSLSQRVDGILTLAVVNRLSWDLIFVVVRLEGVRHLGRVDGQSNLLQVLVLTVDVIGSWQKGRDVCCVDGQNQI